MGSNEGNVYCATSSGAGQPDITNCQQLDGN
jgi:hypothetical protein